MLSMATSTTSPSRSQQGGFRATPRIWARNPAEEQRQHGEKRFKHDGGQIHLIGSLFGRIGRLVHSLHLSGLVDADPRLPHFGQRAGEGT